MHTYSGVAFQTSSVSTSGVEKGALHAPVRVALLPHSATSLAARSLAVGILHLLTRCSATGKLGPALLLIRKPAAEKFLALL